MDREQLTALRDTLDAVLKLPDSLRNQIVQWLVPEATKPGERPNRASKPNGHDPPPVPSLPAPRSVNIQRLVQASESRARAAEQKLLKAMRDNPNLSVIALANAEGGSRSATGERLRRLAAEGTVEEDLTGRWRLKGEGPISTEDEARPTEASPS
jgi:hypothetical protein